MNLARPFNAYIGGSLLLLTALAGCEEDRPPKELKSAASSIKHLIKVAKVESDPTFQKQLVDDGQREDHRAPEALRSALRDEEIARWIVSQGVVLENGRVALYWRISDCGIVGNAPDVRKRLVDRLTAMGFDPFPSPDRRYKLGYRRHLADAEEAVLLKEPGNWDGGRRVVAGTELLWTVRSTSPAPLPTYTEITQIMPELRDRRIDESVYKMFQDAKLVRVECGGTWTKYYSLRVDIASFPDHTESSKALRQEMLDRLEDAGFKQGERPKRSTWDIFRPDSSPHSRPIIQIKASEDPSCIRLAIQPE